MDDQMDMMGDHDDDSFCKGAMDMNMDGFSSMFDDDPMCINFLFRTWTLDNRTKFAFACIGSCLMGLSVEFLTRSRRLLKEMPPADGAVMDTRRRHNACLLGLYAVQVIIGYAVMLVIMTYNVELFICTIMGLIIGHGFFNLNAPVLDSTDACCSYQDLPGSENGGTK